MSVESSRLTVAANTAILVKRFPKLSETFIAGEVAALRRAGCKLRVASLYTPNEALTHGWMQVLQHRVGYLEQIGTVRAILGLLLALALRPAGLIGLLRLAVRQPQHLRHAAALVQWCRQHGITHIHAHYCTDPAAVADAAASVLGIRFSISAHAKDIYVSKAVQIAGRIRRAHFVATCTAHNVDYLRQLAAGATPVHLLYHGIDTETFSPGTPDERVVPPLIVSVGRLKRKKGFDVLLDACALLRARNLRFRCCVFGYGDQLEVLRQQIDTLGLRDVVALREPVTHDELPLILRSSTLFALPCRVTEDGDRDGIPNSLLEAMACGVPVVSTRISGLPEVVESGINGLLVDENDPSALADAIARLLTDREAARRMGQRGRETVSERFAWGRNIEPLARLLEPRERCVGSIPEAAT